MAGNGGGGIGRFAARKRQAPQPDAPHAAIARTTDGATTEDAQKMANVDTSAVVVDAANATGGGGAATANDAIVDGGESSSAMETDEQHTAIFHPYGYDEDHDGGRPTTSGSNVFSSFGNMFENTNDDDAATTTGDAFFSSTPAEFMNEANFGQGYDEYVVGDYQGLEGAEYQGSPQQEGGGALGRPPRRTIIASH